MTDAATRMPSFMTAPGETDVLFVLVGIFLLVAVFLLGVFYFKLHALPERMAHANNRIQYQVVAVLALLGLLTHNNLFWIAALLLATIQLPDLMGKLTSMAASLERMAAAGNPATAEPAPAASDSEPPAAPRPDAAAPAAPATRKEG
ncbi:MAG: hypothetical protein ACK5MY_10045 [Jhaorihella sp.]